MMEYFLLFLLAIPFPLILFLFRKYRKSGGTNRPPGPPGLPIIGNLHQLDYLALYRQLWHLSKKYGPLMSLQLGFQPVLVVSSPEMAKEVLKTHDVEFASRPAFLRFQKLSYNFSDVAVSPYNEYWREMRKICVLHLFSAKRVQSFCSIRENEVYKMIKKIEKLACDSIIVNLSEMLFLFTSTIISRTTCGKCYDDESGERSKFHNLLSEFQAVSVSFYVSDYFPFMSWVDRLIGESNRLEKTFKELDGFIQEMVDEHLIDEKRKESGHEEDFVDVLLKLQKDASFSIKLTLDNIKAIIVDIFVGGTDTSAATLVWAMTELVKNPTTMNRIQQEIRNTAGNKSIVDETDFQKFPYLQAVIKETLRFHPPVPLTLPHETTQQCNVAGYEILPKTVVYVNAWAIGRDPESWENPENFLPERFLGSSIDFRGKDFKFIPFGAGRRGCPGINMGVATMELALANLLYWFDWELPEGMKREEIDTDAKPGVTIHKKNPLCLVARKYCGRVIE